VQSAGFLISANLREKFYNRSTSKSILPAK
jgi:hypothetical protein